MRKLEAHGLSASSGFQLFGGLNPLRGGVAIGPSAWYFCCIGVFCKSNVTFGAIVSIHLTLHVQLNNNRKTFAGCFHSMPNYIIVKSRYKTIYK